MKKMKKSSCKIALLQSLGLITYISLVATIFWKGNVWFGKMNNFIGPLAMLTIFALSALICALITLSYPFTLWQKGDLKEALNVIVYTTLWTAGFLLLLLTSLALF